MLTILLFQVVPLVLGMEIARRNESLSARLARPIGIAAILSLVLILALIALPGAKAVAALLGTRSLAATVVLSAAALGVGWWLGGPRLDLTATGRSARRER